MTGSGKETGIGAGIAETLARAGARVVVNYVSDSTAPRAAKVTETIEAAAGRSSVTVVQADVATVEGSQKLVDATLRDFEADHIDILREHLWGVGMLEGLC